MALDGVTVTTVEGLAPDGDLHPLQDAFIRHDAFQCGYCTPGRLCSAVGMLGEAGPSAIPADLETEAALTPGEIRERMSGNLCRCGAYVNIVRAIAEIASPGSGTVRAFTYTRAQDASDAVARYRTGTAYLGGGTNLVDLMRLGVATPDQLGDVSRLRYNRWRRPWTAACGLVRTVDFGGVRAMPGVLAVLPCTDPPALGSAEDPELALFTTRQVSGPGASTILLAQHYPNSPVYRLGLPRPVDRDRPQAGRRRRRRRPDHLRSRPGHRQALVEIARPHGRLDVLVNNAGTCDGGPLEQQSLDHLRRVVEST